MIMRLVLWMPQRFNIFAMGVILHCRRRRRNGMHLGPKSNGINQELHMKKISSLILCLAGCLCISAQLNPEAPVNLLVGSNSITIPPDSYRLNAYYKLTAVDDQLVTIDLPVEQASFGVTHTGGVNTTSDISVLSLSYSDKPLLRKIFAMRGGETLYVEFGLNFFALMDFQDVFTFNVAIEEHHYDSGNSCGDPIDGNGSNIYLPLTIDPDNEALLKPVYVSYKAEKDGWLYLLFTPSVTRIDYASSCEGTYTYLKHEYIPSGHGGRDAKARLEVKQGYEYMFKVQGFEASMLTTEIIEPVAGEHCDFPIDIEPGEEITLPAAAGDYYWSFEPPFEGFVEVTSQASLDGGFVEVMFDCMQTGAFIIYDALNLRKHVYDRMEYLLHIHKANATGLDEKVLLNVVKEELFDSFSPGQPLTANMEITTPPFAGIYNYSITSPSENPGELVLETIDAPANADTRVNLYDASDNFRTLARGFDMRYAAAPATDYVLVWTVFDEKKPIAFKVRFNGNGAGVEQAVGEVGFSAKATSDGIIVTCGDKAAVIYDVAGRLVDVADAGTEHVVSVPPGIYVVKCGSVISKVAVN